MRLSGTIVAVRRVVWAARVAAVFAAVIAVAVAADPAAGQTRLVPLSMPPPVQVGVSAISANGKFVVGFTRFGADFNAFRWSIDGGFESVGGGGYQSRAFGVSADGSIVTGYEYHFAPFQYQHSFRWSASGTPHIEWVNAECGNPNGPVIFDSAGISDDGSVIVGTGFYDYNDLRGVRWVSPGPGECLAGMSYVHGVSGNGRVVFGNAVFSDDAIRFVDGAPVSMGEMRPSAASFDGSVIVGYFWGTSHQAFRWTANGGMQSLGTLPNTDTSEAVAVTRDGSAVVGNSYNSVTFSFRPFLWTAALGMVDLSDYLPTVGVDLTGWTLSGAAAIQSDDTGMRIVVGGQYNGQPAVCLVEFGDMDGDGLLDDWEINGIPYKDAGGGDHRYMLPDANPKRKDIYVEIDAMAGLMPPAVVTNRVITAFEQSPVPPVPGLPGAEGGVRLHLDRGDAGLPLYAYTLPGTNGWIEFQLDKAAWFGSQQERLSPDWAQMAEAKRKAYRYCVFAQQQAPFLNGNPNGFSGVAELDPGHGTDDFMITLGSWGPQTDDAIAGTFMHELGHTLGLGHGGGDNKNHKPNYYSIMNYLWQLPSPYNDTQTGGYRLDYSRGAWPTLDEGALDESAGIGGDVPFVQIPFMTRAVGATLFDFCGAPSSFLGQCAQTVPGHPLECVNYALASGSVDWNNDGFIGPIVPFASETVCGNPNNIRDGDYSGLQSGQVLEGYDDWANLRYNFRDSIYYASGVAAPPDPSPCIDLATAEYLRLLPPPPVRCPGVPPVAGTPSPVASAACSLVAVNFTIAPQGTGPFKVQWRRFVENPIPSWVDVMNETMPNGTVIGGSKGPMLAIIGAHESDLGPGPARFVCHVTDFCDQTSDSAECVLTFAPAVAATSPLVVAACENGTATFAVGATGGGPFSYYWKIVWPVVIEFESSHMDHGTAVQGKQTPTLTLSGLRAADFPLGTYRLACRVQDACGGVTVGPEFTLIVGSLAITSHPADVDLTCAGAASATFVAGASGSEPLVYQWYRDGAPVSNSGGVSGAAGATLTITNPGGTHAGYYSCLVSNMCGEEWTDEAVLNVGPPRLMEQPYPAAACVGGDAYLSAWVVGALPRAYQWMRGGVDLVDDSRISGSQTADLNITGVLASDAGSYTVRVHSDCGDVVSQGATLAVFDQPVTVQTMGDRVMCPTGTSVLTVTAGPADQEPWLQYLWLVEIDTAPGQLEYVNPQLMSGSTVCANVSGLGTRTLSVAWTGAGGCASSRRFECYVYGPCSEALAGPVTVRLCRADFDCSGSLAVADIFSFLNAWFAGSSTADVNGGGLAVSDIFSFLNSWFGGC